MWTDETRNFVRDRWADGASASEISREIRDRYHVSKSRNAIIGYIFRAGLTRINGGQDSQMAQRVARARASQRAKRQATMSRAQRELFSPRTPKAAKPKAETRSLRDQLILSLEPLEPARRISTIGAHECRYMHGDPRGEWAFCARPKQHGSSFCVHHTRLCYRVAPEQQSQQGAGAR